MSFRNLEWYNLNEQRSWPCADQATEIDDEGRRMPDNLIVDMNMRFPETVGAFAYIAAITVGPGIATVTFLSAEHKVPLAACSVAKPVVPYRQYQLESLYPGVSGWVTFGEGLLDGKLHTHRFSNSFQTILMPHVARKYREMPIGYVGKYGANAHLTGIVKLLGGDDVEIVSESREILGSVRNAIVFRLAGATTAQSESLLSKYVGPCGGRPESQTCGQPPPIEFINSVGPDCCGNMTMEFRGCAKISIVENEACSVLVDCGLGLNAACITKDKLPDKTGKLPNEYPDICSVSYMVDLSLPLTQSAIEMAPAEIEYVSIAASEQDILGYLPVTEDFSNAEDLAVRLSNNKFMFVRDTWHPVFGGTSLMSYRFGPSDVQFEKLAEQPGWSSLHRSVTAHFAVRNTSHSANASLVLNLRDPIDGLGGKTWWSVTLDIRGDKLPARGLHITRHNDFARLAVRPIANLSCGVQYEMSAKVLPGPGDAAWCFVKLRSVLPKDSAMYVEESLGPVLLEGYGPATGTFGFSTLDCETELNRIVIQNEVS